MVFLSREEAGTRLAQEIRSQGLVFDLCCGIPRGGVVVGSVVAQELGLPFGQGNAFYTEACRRR